MSKLLVDEISDADNTGPVTVTDGLTVQGAFTSLGIDDNATSTAMTIDSSENVLVGTTSAYGTTGTTINAAGLVYSSADGDRAGQFDRTTSDGEIVRFSKTGTTVGSIGTYEGTTVIAGKYTGLKFNYSDATNSFIHTVSPSGVIRDAVDDLGYSGSRFKDLYLSGGVYLGGTGAANYLDDYEEGTWTPIPSSGSFSSNYGTYTKVGRLVTAKFFCDFSSAGVGSGAMQISGLPFGLTSSYTGYAPGLLMVDNLTTAINNMTIQPSVNSSHFILIVGNGSTGNHSGAAASLFKISSTFRGLIVYETA